MSRVIIRPEADRDLDDIADYLDQSSRQAGRRFYQAAQSAFRQLAGMPRLGTPYMTDNPELAGLRCWRTPSFPKYIIFYLPLDDGVRVVRILHGSRDIELILGEEEGV
jgi:toxin ParE1/3/4